MSDEIRTWTLEGGPSTCPSWPHLSTDPARVSLLKPRERAVEVIKKAPVLDLLERAWREDPSICPAGVDAESCPACALSNEIEALLKANGRLT